MTKIVVNGTFDILHVGHIKLLNYAKTLGNNLLVCIDSDDRVRRLKGANRPINNQMERRLLLLNLKAVDAVEIFDTDEDLENILSFYEPDIMVKGSDYKNKPIVGSKYCKDIVFYDRIVQYSTTQKIQDIIDR